MICVIGITEVLLARMVSGRTCCSISAKVFCFSGMSSSTASTTKSASRTQSASAPTGAHALHGFLVVAKVAQVGRDALLRRVEIGRVRIRDGDVMAGEREHLRDAMAHQPGADDGDFGFGHSALARVPGAANALDPGHRANPPVYPPSA